MRFPPALLDEIRARLPVSQVVARKVKLKRQGREYAGLSPFKTEKSASFFVNDQKGFYHCLAAETRVLTQGGPVPIGQLAGRVV